MIVQGIPAFEDNYLWAAWSDANPREVCFIDPGDASVLGKWLADNDKSLKTILLTHHHADHVGGVRELMQLWPDASVYGPRGDAAKIAASYEPMQGGQQITVLGQTAQVIDVPGHTNGHIAWWFADAGKVFVGDTLFSLGCGRLFEGTASMMWESMQKLRALPDSTMVYCAHEYTASNCAFALSVDANNSDLLERAAQIKSLRARGLPTVPTSIGLESRTNPFMRADRLDLALSLGLNGASAAEVFAELRGKKDHFRAA